MPELASRRNCWGRRPADGRRHGAAASPHPASLLAARSRARRLRLVGSAPGTRQPMGAPAGCASRDRRWRVAQQAPGGRRVHRSRATSDSRAWRAPRFGAESSRGPGDEEVARRRQIQTLGARGRQVSRRARRNGRTNSLDPFCSLHLFACFPLVAQRCRSEPHLRPPQMAAGGATSVGRVAALDRPLRLPKRARLGALTKSGANWVRLSRRHTPRSICYAAGHFWRPSWRPAARWPAHQGHRLKVSWPTGPAAHARATSETLSRPRGNSNGIQGLAGAIRRHRRAAGGRGELVANLNSEPRNRWPASLGWIFTLGRRNRRPEACGRSSGQTDVCVLSAYLGRANKWSPASAG